jgi:hypothetical protein
MVNFIGYEDIEVVERPRPYPEDIYKKMPALDSFLKVPTAEELEISLFGAPIADTSFEESAPVEENTGLDFDTPVLSVGDVPETPAVAPETPVASAPADDFDDLTF